jgi:hypothetical protein
MINLDDLSDDELDSSLRRKADDYHSEPWENAWSRMEVLLDDKQRKRRIFVFWRNAAAILFFLGFGWLSTYYFNKKNDTELSIDYSKNKNEKSEQIKQSQDSEDSLKEGKIEDLSTDKDSDALVLNNSSRNRNIKNRFISVQKTNSSKINGLVANKKLADTETSSKNLTIEESKIKNGLDLNPEIIRKEISKDNENAILVLENGISRDSINETKNAESYDFLAFSDSDTTEILLEENSDQKNLGAIFAADLDKNRKEILPFSLSIGFSPDFSMVRTPEMAKMGNNFQILMAYQFSERWKIQTGLMMANKRYGAMAEDYQWPSYWGKPASPLKSVNASCKLIDIPLNVYYSFILKEKSNFFTSFGVSAYRMLNEKYEYNYENNSNPNIKMRNWEGNSSEKVGLNTLNFSLGYEIRLLPAMSLQLEPFAKLPISQMGSGKVKLISTGVFLNLKSYFGYKKEGKDLISKSFK